VADGVASTETGLGIASEIAGVTTAVAGVAEPSVTASTASDVIVEVVFSSGVSALRSPNNQAIIQDNKRIMHKITMETEIISHMGIKVANLLKD
jgi:hypothetical protein